MGSGWAERSLGSFGACTQRDSTTTATLVCSLGARLACSFVRDEGLAQGAMSIDCSHDDFTAIEDDAILTITVSYNRPIEGEALRTSRRDRCRPCR